MTDLRERLAAPPTASAAPWRPSRRLLLALTAAVLLFALVVTWVVAYSPLFGVRSVHLRGATSGETAQIERVAGIGHGTPLVRIDTDAVARRVRSIADVASARVDTSFPSTVTITVTLRRAVGYVEQGTGAVLVDRDGVQFRTVAVPPAGLPRFVVPAGADARATAAALGTVAAVLHGTQTRVTSLQALDPHSITVTIAGRDGEVLVRWGAAAASAVKARLLPSLLKHHPSLVDLTDPDQPYVR